MTKIWIQSRAALAAGVCALLLSAVPLRADDDPAPAVVATMEAVVDMTIGKPPGVIEGMLPEIRARMEESFATRVIVQRAFGRNWQKLSPAQQDEAIDLLGRIVIRTYATQLSTGGRPVIKITASREIAPNRREIVSTITQDGQMVNVVYLLAPIDGAWKVYDILAEGVSVVGNYRQQFDSHFQSGTAEGLIELLQKKLAEAAPAKTEGGA